MEEIMAKTVDYENLIIDLYLFWRLERKGGRVTTAKLFYLLEDDLFNRNMIGPRYKMYKFEMGPYNLDIATHLNNLSENGFLSYDVHYYAKIEKDVKSYYSNKKTEHFIKDIDELIQKNSKIFNIFDKIIQELGDLNSDLLMELIYSLDKTGSENKRIEDYKPKSLILNPLSLPNPDFIFELDESWYNTVEILLNPDLSEMVSDIIKNANKDRFVLL